MLFRSVSQSRYTPIITPTPTRTPTRTITPSNTLTNTPTNTVTPTFTPTMTPTITITPSQTLTPTVTHTIYEYLQFFLDQKDILIPNNSTYPACGQGNTIGVASHYPATFTVTGIESFTFKVVLRIINYSHQFPGDVGILLVSPTSACTLIAGQLGEGTEQQALSADVIFDDDATTEWDGYTSGYFKPYTYYQSDTALPAFELSNGCPPPLS